MPQLMGIDLGTSSVKVLVVDDRGRILAQASDKYPILTPHEGFAEQDPRAWWNATKEAVRKVLSSGRVDCGGSRLSDYLGRCMEQFF